MADNKPRSAEPILTNRRIAILVAIAVVLALLALFVADNFVLVEIRLINFDVRMRLAWAVLVPMLLGIAIGYLAGRLRR